MKICYVANDPVPSPKGASVRIRQTVEALRALGHEVELLTQGTDDITSFPHDLIDLPDGNFLQRMMKLREEVSAWLKGRKAEVVQFRSIWEGIPAVAWAKRHGATIVFEAHGFPSVELPYRFSGLDDKVLSKVIDEENAVLRAADRVLTVSRTGARFLRMRGVAAERVSVIPNPVDTSLFAPSEPPPDAPPLRLVYEGTLAAWQGLEGLLEAMAEFRGAANVELHVVGPAKGAQAARLKALARRLRIHHAVRISGAMAQADLVPVLRTAHVCVAPMPNDPRNALQGCCPIKLLEYMACGRPVLATFIPPVEEIVEHGKTGWLVEPTGPAALAGGIAWMKEHAAEREVLGVAARKEMEARWTIASFRERLGAVIE
jgi:glycosyltransferase involved in cell wall biosynthesis